MSLTKTRQYFRDRLIELKLKEWVDAFNFENIPSNILDKSFHIENGQITGIKRNHTDQELNFPVTIRIFLKGYKTPVNAIDKSIELTENLIKNACNPVNALTQGGIKNIIFESASNRVLDPSNDNLVVCELNFRAFVIIGE